MNCLYLWKKHPLNRKHLASSSCICWKEEQAGLYSAVKGRSRSQPQSLPLKTYLKIPRSIHIFPQTWKLLINPSTPIPSLTTNFHRKDVIRDWVSNQRQRHWVFPTAAGLEAAAAGPVKPQGSWAGSDFASWIITEIESEFWLQNRYCCDVTIVRRSTAGSLGDG